MLEPLRFLHVADANLDQPLRDVGTLPPTLQRLAEDATHIAFEQLIQGAIDQDVDFVLFAGNTFREADQSLFARMEICQGMQRLVEHDISVFVLPGPNDPEAAWRNMPDLPNHVTVLSTSDYDEDESATPVAVLREGRVIATISAGTLSQLSAGRDAVASEADEVGPKPSTNGHARSVPFRVGLISEWPTVAADDLNDGKDLAGHLSACQCDYLGVPASNRDTEKLGWNFAAGQTINTQEGLAHHPGRLQGLAASETGPHGATLIEVDHDGELRGTFLPFASVRRLSIVVPVEPSATLEEIRQAVQAELETETVQTGERAWLVSAILEGTSECLESLKDSVVEADFLESLPQSPTGHREVPIHFDVKIQKALVPVGREQDQSDLERLYFETLEDNTRDHSGLMERLTDAIDTEISLLEKPEEQQRLKSLLPEIVPRRVIASARALGHDWFGESRED